MSRTAEKTDALRRAEARIYEIDRGQAPGSETVLLGHALQSLRETDDVEATLAWWEGAYRLHGWALEHPDAAEKQYGDVGDYILNFGDDLEDWQEPDGPRETMNTTTWEVTEMMRDRLEYDYPREDIIETALDLYMYGLLSDRAGDWLREMTDEEEAEYTARYDELARARHELRPYVEEMLDSMQANGADR